MQKSSLREGERKRHILYKYFDRDIVLKKLETQRSRCLLSFFEHQDAKEDKTLNKKACCGMCKK